MVCVFVSVWLLLCVSVFMRVYYCILREYVCENVCMIVLLWVSVMCVWLCLWVWVLKCLSFLGFVFFMVFSEIEGFIIVKRCFYVRGYLLLLYEEIFM